MSSPGLRRTGITLIVLAAALGAVALSIWGGRGKPPAPPLPASADSRRPDAPGAEAVQAPPDTGAPELPPDGGAAARVRPGPDAAPDTLRGLRATPAGPGAAPPAALGSLDRRRDLLCLEFSAAGAGIERIVLTPFYDTAAHAHEAEDHYRALESGDPGPPPLPAEKHRYVLQTAQPYLLSSGREVMIPVLAANRIEVNGQAVDLLGAWRETGPGRFETVIADEDGREVLRLGREYQVGHGYDFTLRQRVTNLTTGPLDVRWRQYGPGDLVPDRSRYMDRRRYLFGARRDPVQYPGVIDADDDLLVERGEIVKRFKKALAAADLRRRDELLTLWPPASRSKREYDLVWFGAQNRYFALAVHPAAGADGALTFSLGAIVEDIELSAPGADDRSRVVFTALYSPARRIEPGGETAFDLGVYAGPLDRAILGGQEPMASLRLKDMILYQISGWCSFCTFQWLAHLLIVFLSAVHFLVRDWGMAIIILVVVVRTLLHPVTRKSQVNIQRFSKAMTDLKPEIERIQQKYRDDPRKAQQEQMKLFRERGVNPFTQALGCLPMFLQMPIWIALYAMLYFAFELRQEPAGWGVFQLLWGWPLLADLSAADHCFWEFAEPFTLLGFINVTGINALPILMGLVFYFQQKYMSPPPSPTMTREQLQQQRIMKVMMVVMFPVMLYSAPSGLTLYIFTSSLFGIVESRYIRRHIKELDLKPPKPGLWEALQRRARKPRDPQARAFADAVERARTRKKKSRRPPRKYKER